MNRGLFSGVALPASGLSEPATVGQHTFSSGPNGVGPGVTTFLGDGTLSSTPPRVEIIAPQDVVGTVLTVRADGAPGAGAARTYRYTVMVNNEETELDITLNGTGDANRVGSVVAKHVQIRLNDKVSLRLITGASAAIFTHSATVLFGRNA